MNMQSNDGPDSPLDPQAVAPVALAPTRPLYWSVRRELWENRSIYVAPLTVGAVYSARLSDRPIWAARSMRALTDLNLDTRSSSARHALRPAGMLLTADRVPGRDLLLARRAARRTPRSQHPVLEVAAGFRSYDRALEGRHPSRGSADDRLRRHRSPATDHATAEHAAALLGAAKYLRPWGYALVRDGIGAALRPIVLALWHAPLYMLDAVDLGLGAARDISLGRVAAACDCRSETLPSTLRIWAPRLQTALPFAAGAFDLKDKNGVPIDAHFIPLEQLAPGRFLSSPSLWFGLIFAAYSSPRRSGCDVIGNRCHSRVR